MEFVAHIDGDGGIDAATRLQVRDGMKGMAGKKIRITIVEYREKRSKKQNNRYWALLTIGAKSLWEDPSMKDSLHEALAHDYFGLPPCPKTGVPRRRRTPDTETPDFGRYMDWCVGKLTDYGADLSEWDEETRKVEAG